MKVFVVIKDSEIPNRDDCPNRELVEIDCVKSTLNGALERIRELTVSGYRCADYRESWLT